MTIDIAFSLNRALQVPLLVVINSILRNASYSIDNDSAGSVPLRFNIVVPLGDRTFFMQKIQAAFSAEAGEKVGSAVGPAVATFRVREFSPPDYLKHYLDSKFKEKKTERRISRYMQYARLFLKEIFPDVSRVIYLDGDTLMLDDVRSLFAQGDGLTPQRYLAAVPQFFPAVFYFSNPFKVWSDLCRFKSSFNSGVLLTDLFFWTEETYDCLRHYLALDAKNNYRLYHLGDETIFNLMFKESYIPLATKWNSCGYGQPHWISRLLRKDPKKISVIHWSGGHHKPWQSPRVIYSAIWRGYVPGARRSVSLVSMATAVSLPSS